MRGHFKRQCIQCNDAHPISFSTVYFHLRHNRQFFRGYSPRRVFWHNFVCICRCKSKKRQIRCSSALRRVSLRVPCAHRTPRAGAELGSFTSFSVCMFKLRFEFVGSDAGGHEGELGSVLPSVRCGSLCAHRTRRASTQLIFFHVLCLNALNSFECLNWQGLKTPVNYKLSWCRAAVARQLSWASFLGWPQPVGWDCRGPL